MPGAGSTHFSFVARAATKVRLLLRTLADMKEKLELRHGLDLAAAGS
jgi:hypothetical protein